MTKSFDYTAKPLTSTKIFSDKVSNLLNNNNRCNIIFYTTFETADRKYENVGFATKQKYMSYSAPDYTVNFVKNRDGYDVTIGSDVFARGVFLSLEGIDNFFSDNYFNIMPKCKKTIHVTTTLSETDFQNQLKIISMGDVHARTDMSNNATNMKRDANFKPLGGN